MSSLREALHKFDQLTDEHSRRPVPESKTVSGIQIGLLCIGISITLPGLYSGGELGQNLGLADGILASLLGGLILSIMSVPAAIVGVKTRLSSYMVIEHVFGRHGAKPINLVFGLVLLGWYAVTAELFGRTLFLTAQEYTTLSMPEWQFTIASSTLVVATSIFGFKAIDRLAIVAVPLLLLFLVYVAYLSLEHKPVQSYWTIDKQAIDMSAAISAVVGTMIVNVVLMPDLSRYARTVKNSVTASFLGNGFGSAISMMLAMVPALAFNELDPMKYMAILGLTG
ncbi:MAG: cytosine permease, partial [Pseudomonadales bacterium]